MKNMKYILKVILDIIRTSPWACIYIFVYYLFSGIYPGLSTHMQERIFMSATKMIGLEYTEFSNVLWRFIALFLLKNVFDMSVDAPRSCGIYTKVQYEMERRLADTVSRFKYIEFEKNDIYQAIYKGQASINNKYFQKIYFGILEVISSGTGVIGVMFVLHSFNPILLPITIISIVPLLIVRIVQGSQFYVIWTKQSHKKRELNYLWNLFSDSIAVKEIRTYKCDKFVFDKWKSKLNDIIKEKKRVIIKSGVSLLICNILQNVGMAIGIYICFNLLQNDKLNASQFATCIAAIITTHNLFGNILHQMTSVFDAVRFISDYYDVRDKDIKKAKVFDNREINIDSIKFEKVDFQYPTNEKLVINNVDLHIEKGQAIAIIGENGSGKTTIAKLMMGLYKPSNGRILYNGIDRCLIDDEVLFSKISVLSQYFTKYRLTIKENIGISNTKHQIDSDKVYKLLKITNMEKYSNEQYLNTMLGKEFGGIEISGGEWQKIAIARSLYRESDLLVLDEPTSAIDPNFESEILKCFVNMKRQDKIIVIVTHRLSICPFIDNILVVQNGKILASGGHRELYENCQYYRNIYDEQRKWYV